MAFTPHKHSMLKVDKCNIGAKRVQHRSTFMYNFISREIESNCVAQIKLQQTSNWAVLGYRTWLYHSSKVTVYFLLLKLSIPLIEHKNLIPKVFKKMLLCDGT